MPLDQSDLNYQFKHCGRKKSGISNSFFLLRTLLSKQIQPKHNGIIVLSIPHLCIPLMCFVSIFESILMYVK